MRIAFRNGRVLAWSVPVLAEAAALGRSVVFAWAIGVDELGRAMMLALAVRLVEMASDVGVERLIVQAPDGDTKPMQGALQGVAILRAGVASVVMLALAPALAWMFDDGPTAATFAALVVIPVLNGFGHLDYRRAERQFQYRQMAVVEVGATVAMLAALGPAVAVWADHRAMAAVLIVQAGTRMMLSHLVAARQYEVLFCTKTMMRSWRFGAPLMLNAGLLFLTFYADRLIVAQAYDWATLALYGVVLQLAMLPAQIVGRAAGSVVLPTLRAELESRRFDVVWPRILLSHVVLAGGMILGFTL
ncbi:MAG: oligosaccharide flippase family protein, partial [Marinomonas sp.]